MIVGMKHSRRSWLMAGMLITSQFVVHAHWSDNLPFKRFMAKKPTMNYFTNIILSKYGLGIGAGLLLLAAAAILWRKPGGGDEIPGLAILLEEHEDGGGGGEGGAAVPAAVLPEHDAGVQRALDLSRKEAEARENQHKEEEEQALQAAIAESTAEEEARKGTMEQSSERKQLEDALREFALELAAAEQKDEVADLKARDPELQKNYDQFRKNLMPLLQQWYDQLVEYLVQVNNKRTGEGTTPFSLKIVQFADSSSCERSSSNGNTIYGVAHMLCHSPSRVGNFLVKLSLTTNNAYGVFAQLCNLAKQSQKYDPDSMNTLLLLLFDFTAKMFAGMIADLYLEVPIVQANKRMWNTIQGLKLPEIMNVLLPNNMKKEWEKIIKIQNSIVNDQVFNAAVNFQQARKKILGSEDLKNKLNNLKDKTREVQHYGKWAQYSTYDLRIANTVVAIDQVCNCFLQLTCIPEQECNRSSVTQGSLDTIKEFGFVANNILTDDSWKHIAFSPLQIKPYTALKGLTKNLIDGHVTSMSDKMPLAYTYVSEEADFENIISAWSKLSKTIRYAVVNMQTGWTEKVGIFNQLYDQELQLATVEPGSESPEGSGGEL